MPNGGSISIKFVLDLVLVVVLEKRRLVKDTALYQFEDENEYDAEDERENDNEDKK
jgi:hypothetical protein